MKFKIGDEARVLRDPQGVPHGSTVGDICEVINAHKSDTDNSYYLLSNGYWYREGRIEKIVDHDVLMQKVLERNNKPDIVTNEEGHKELKTDKYARHKEITDYMHKTYVSKNKDYGNSFERTHKEIGSRASLGRIADKFYRLQNIILNDEQLVEDETVKDTLIDMANYAIMFAMELEEEE